MDLVGKIISTQDGVNSYSASPGTCNIISPQLPFTLHTNAPLSPSVPLLTFSGAASPSPLLLGQHRHHFLRLHLTSHDYRTIQFPCSQQTWRSSYPGERNLKYVNERECKEVCVNRHS